MQSSPLSNFRQNTQIWSFLNINHKKCWPQTNALPGISPAKMGLFRISKELQFWVCNHDEPHAGPPAQGMQGCLEAVQNPPPNTASGTARTQAFWVQPGTRPTFYAPSLAASLKVTMQLRTQTPRSSRSKLFIPSLWLGSFLQMLA